MYSNLPLPKLLEIISRIVNDSGCTVRIVDEIPVQDREIRELCLQIYELRRAAQSIAHGELGVHFENCGCMATYLKDIMDRLKAVEAGDQGTRGGRHAGTSPLGGPRDVLRAYRQYAARKQKAHRQVQEPVPDRQLTACRTGAASSRWRKRALPAQGPQAAEHFLYHGGHRSFQEGQRPARP